MIRIVLVLFSFLLILTSIIWFFAARSQEKYIEDLISKNLNPKFKITYSLKTTGYPNRVDTNIKGIKLISKDDSKLIHIRNILLMSLIYSQKKYVLAIETPINIKIGTNLIEFSAQKLITSISKKKNEYLNVFTVHGQQISLIFNKNLLLEVEDFIFANRSKSSSFQSNKNEIFIKLNKPIVDDLHNDKNERYSFNFNLDQLKEFQLSNQLVRNEFLKKNLSFSDGRIEVEETNINSTEHLSKFLKYIDELFIN